MSSNISQSSADVENRNKENRNFSGDVRERRRNGTVDSTGEDAIKQ
jgi:hypothetical protein